MRPAFSPWLVLAVICASTFTVSVAALAVNVALPSLVVGLGATTRDLQWIVDAYNLVFSTFVLAFGSLSDRYGRKGALLAGLVVYGLAALAASRADSPESLIAGQAVMGLGAAMIFPATLSILTNVFPERGSRAKAIGLWGATAGLGAGCGPVLGGWLLESYAWPSVFVAFAVLAALTLVASAVVLTTSRDPAAPRIDVVGLVLSVLGIGALVYTVIEAPHRGWLAPLTLGGFVAAVIVIVLFVLWENNCPEPMFDITLFSNPRFTASSAAVAFAYFALFGFVFLITQYFQFVRLYSPLSTGLRILPVAMCIAVGSVLGVVLAVRVGNKIVVTVGMLCFTVAFVWISTATAATAYPLLVLQMIPLGLGVGLTTAPATEAIMGAVSADKAGIGSATNDATRELGGTLGVAVIGSVYVSVYTSNFTSAPVVGLLPAEARDLVDDSIGAAQTVGGYVGVFSGRDAGQAVVDAAAAAFVHGLSTACLVAAGVTTLGALIAWLLLPARPPAPTPAPAPALAPTVAPALIAASDRKALAQAAPIFAAPTPTAAQPVVRA